MAHKLYTIKKKRSGRDSSGHVSVRHRGGEQKRYLRLLDNRRSKMNISARVTALEYDPNRTAKLAYITYEDGAKNFVLATANMKTGDVIITADNAPIRDGNRLMLKNIPVGIPIHGLEFQPGKGAQLVKSAGSAAFIQSIDGDKAIVKLPSGELRIFSSNSFATIGQISNADHFNQKLKKAGDSRHRGWRPSVRGVAQNPHSHPHGGGEGKSSVGMNPKTPWGKPAMGLRTRKKKKSSNKFILERRKK